MVIATLLILTAIVSESEQRTVNARSSRRVVVAEPDEETTAAVDDETTAELDETLDETTVTPAGRTGKRSGDSQAIEQLEVEIDEIEIVHDNNFHFEDLMKIGL